MNINIYTDGGARGNPGPAAVGVVIEKIVDGRSSMLTEFGKVIGETTNNVAEYTAVIEALLEIKKLETMDRGHVIEFFLDSTLVVNQLNGIFKVKDATLRVLMMKVRSLEQEIGVSIFYKAIPREQNRRADFLVNQALDKNFH